MFRRADFFLLLALAFCACSAQPQEAQQTATAPAQAATPSQPDSSSILKQEGCTVDMKRVCQAFIDQPEFPINGQRFTWERFVNSSPPHTEIELPAGLLGKDTQGTARCQVTTHSRKVTDGRLLSGGPSIAKTMEYFKQNGWCQEASPDYDKLIAEVIRKLAANL
jgi:hypothetical protein